MANDATQNPTNKWARNSGAGPAGISYAIPTAAEARRGLQPFSTDGSGSAGRILVLALTATVGAVIAAAAVMRARQPKALPDRILRRVRMR